MNRYFIGISALLAFTACGGGDSAAPADTNTPASKPADNGSDTKAPDKAPDTGAADTGSTPKAGKQDWAASMGTATVSGMVKFEGTAPATEAVDHSGSDPVCTVAIMDESIVVADGALANVVISVSKGLGGYKFAKGTGSVSLDQKGCRYVPHALAMQQGQTISISNSDGTVHNVHSYSKRNQGFNTAQPAGTPAIEKQMKQKDKMFAIKCDMHSWMSCNVVVFDHPFFAVSDAAGKFTLPKLPAGDYTLTAEHETLGKQTATVTVTDGGTGDAAFSFKM
ncbi:MAG: plastocyanin [Planctomycetota bacterium]|jgi:plastocyanin